MMDPDRGLMPLPRQLRWRDGPVLPGGGPLRVRYAGVETARLVAAVDRWLTWWQATASARVTDRQALAVRPIELVIDCQAPAARWPALGDDESYRLAIGDGRIELAAAAEWGVLRALATLTQLAAGDGGLVPVEIDDAPRFPWRGVTLDVARHFIPSERLRTTLDAMALFKLNVLHLHLSDDQGFRFPSRAYPRLASARAYQRDELEALVQYAAARGIRIVPELDMPGHTTSWLVAYPQWGCRTAQPSRRFGVHPGCLDPTNPEVDTAVATLLAELAEVFPDAYLHAGGDEVHPEWWTSTPAVAEFMAARGYAGPADLQADFNARVAACVRALGRRMIAWDEVLHPRLPVEVTVQSWRGATARDRALANGHDCVVSADYYLDLFFPADVHYSFDPEASEAALVALEDALGDDPRLAHVAAGMRWTHHWREPPPAPAAGRPRGRILGAQACLWAELVDEHLLDIRLWSRMPALAERFWSRADVRDADDMYRRLRGSRAVLATTGVDIAAQSRQLLASAGLEPAWQPLIDQLEPVKWYARLLGADALAARLGGREMPLARPYHADSPLDRVVDGLLPEAPGAVTLAALCARVGAGDAQATTELRALAGRWCTLPLSGAGPVELEPLAVRLVALGALVLDVIDRRMAIAAAQSTVAAAAAPVGEYLLAAAPVLARWLERAEA